MLANSAAVPVDLEIEVYQACPETRIDPVDLEIEVNQVCPETRIDLETAVQEKLDLHNDMLGTYTKSFTSIRLNVIRYEIWTQRVWAGNEI